MKAASVVCRAASGACDVADLCTGKATACPTDAVRPKGYVCGQAPRVSCSGTSKTCK